MFRPLAAKKRPRCLCHDRPRTVVNLWDFAWLFAALRCKNALFLDGDISAMAVSPSEPVDSNRIGAIFIVTE